MNANELEQHLTGRTIIQAHAKADPADLLTYPGSQDDIAWVSLELDNGTTITIGAHGLHTQGWIDPELTPSDPCAKTPNVPDLDREPDNAEQLAAPSEG